MECGIKPDAQDDTLVTLPQDTKRTRELVIYFLANSTEIPADCMERLEAISSAAKNRKIGQLLIRSSTRTDSSNELDLAIGNERLEVIKSFFRNDRLARKALILELYPIDTREQSGATLEAPRVVEIYSGPVD